MKHYYIRKQDRVVINENDFARECEECSDKAKECNRGELPCYGYYEDRCPFIFEIDTTNHDNEIRSEHDDDRK